MGTADTEVAAAVWHPHLFRWHGLLTAPEEAPLEESPGRTLQNETRGPAIRGHVTDYHSG